MRGIDECTMYLSQWMRDDINMIDNKIKEQITEIHIRTGCEIGITTENRTKLLSEFSNMRRIVDRREMDYLYNSFCNYSLHKFTSHNTNGYIPLPGGHRVRLAGRNVRFETRNCDGVSEFSSFCIRVAHEVIGCSEKLIEHIGEIDGGILIVGTPSSGKTTIIRDFTRIISKSKKVTLIDEKSEIAAVYNGIPQNDIGPNTDVLSGFDKRTGIELGVKNLSPQVIVCDEIGMGKEDESFVSAAVNGVYVVATVHGNEKSIKSNMFIRDLVTRGVFGTLVFLGSDGVPGRIKNIVNAGDFYSTDGGNDCNNFRMSIHGNI